MKLSSDILLLLGLAISPSRQYCPYNSNERSWYGSTSGTTYLTHGTTGGYTVPYYSTSRDGNWECALD